MTFVLPTDRDYKRAKRIKQGTARVDPAYARFLEAFRLRYGFPALTIFLDCVDRRGGPRFPRLAVVVERSRHTSRSTTPSRWATTAPSNGRSHVS